MGVVGGAPYPVRFVRSLALLTVVLDSMVLSKEVLTGGCTLLGAAACIVTGLGASGTVVGGAGDARLTSVSASWGVEYGESERLSTKQEQFESKFEIERSEIHKSQTLTMGGTKTWTALRLHCL